MRSKEEQPCSLPSLAAGGRHPFDLDDTLYDNGPAIARAEQWMLDHLRSEYLATAMLDKPRWLALKRASCCWTTRRLATTSA